MRFSVWGGILGGMWYLWWVGGWVSVSDTVIATYRLIKAVLPLIQDHKMWGWARGWRLGELGCTQASEGLNVGITLFITFTSSVEYPDRTSWQFHIQRYCFIQSLYCFFINTRTHLIIFSTFSFGHYFQSCPSNTLCILAARNIGILISWVSSLEMKGM